MHKEKERARPASKLEKMGVASHARIASSTWDPSSLLDRLGSEDD